jgi:methylthioribose-1-phosphate isomerase
MTPMSEAGAASCRGTGAGVHPVVWQDGVVVMIDQRRLPLEETYLRCETWQQVADAICSMAVRGAPALGVAAGMGMALAARIALRESAGDSARFRAEVQAASKGLFETRPTAYNLPWALKEMERIWCDESLTPETVVQRMEARALRIYEDDLASCRAIGEYGADLILGERPVILTHCNAGALATAGYGTALGVIRSAYARNPNVRVMADETRPLLQGARLTAWELCRDGIPVELITDNMAGYFMQKGLITHVVVGADRITANGDVANKIGTYTVSVLAREHGVPFYVAAPFSTVDRSLADGGSIPIEERAACEVTGFGDVCWAPSAVKVRNPAFDVTPARNVTAIVTDRGVAFPPYEESLRALEAR